MNELFDYLTTLTKNESITTSHKNLDRISPEVL